MSNFLVALLVQAPSSENAMKAIKMLQHWCRVSREQGKVSPVLTLAIPLGSRGLFAFPDTSRVTRLAVGMLEMMGLFCVLCAMLIDDVVVGRNRSLFKA